MRAKLGAMSRRIEEIDRMLAAPETANDMNRFRDLTRERSDLEPVTKLWTDFQGAEADLATAEELRADPDMRDFAEEEVRAAEARMETLVEELRIALLPKDPNDERNIFLEIRAGTGGDESALFAGDLLRMYLRYAEGQGWRTEIVSRSESELGGYREVIVRVIGQGAYSKLKFESGGHRVQRVPVTESQGRIHTSACTVAVLPEMDEVGDVVLNPADLRIDVFRASGAGGQHVQKTDSAVRITHLPTGMTVECQDERSQTQNKARAMAVLAARIRAAQVAEQQAKEASERRSLVGSGDRSERIRTYNFPQGRVTDHRINLTLYRLEAVMATSTKSSRRSPPNTRRKPLRRSTPDDPTAFGPLFPTMTTPTAHEPETIAEHLANAAAQIGRFEAHVLLAHVLGKTREYLIAHDDEVLAPEQATAFELVVSMRAAGTPVPYLTALVRGGRQRPDPPPRHRGADRTGAPRHRPRAEGARPRYRERLHRRDVGARNSRRARHRHGQESRGAHCGKEERGGVGRRHPHVRGRMVRGGSRG